LYCFIAPLPHCPIASLPHCLIAPLPHCLIASLPHCLIASLLHCPSPPVALVDRSLDDPAAGLAIVGEAVYVSVGELDVPFVAIPVALFERPPGA